MTRLVDEGPLNKTLLSNTTLQEEAVSIVSSFFFNIQPQQLHHQHSLMNDWEDIEVNLGKLRTAIVAQVKHLFFDQVVEATCAKG